MEFVTLVGSLEPGSFSRAIANTLDELAPQGVQMRLLGSIDNLPYYDGHTQAAIFPSPVMAMARAISAADAVIIVTPEYIGSIPGALKNALDWLSHAGLQPLAGKPVAIETTSVGPAGGAHCHIHLRQALAFLDAVILSGPEIMVSNVADKVDRQTESLIDEGARKHVAFQLAALMNLVHGSDLLL